MEPNKTKRVIELGIMPEDEISGCSAIALVEEPAIELDFRYFNKEKFVYPSKGEHEDEFIGRCIPYVINEGKDEATAAAICYSYWENSRYERMAGVKVSFDYHETINTERGKELAKEAIANGEDVYIISAGQDKEEFMPLVKELGIDPSKVFATGSNKAKIEKIKELGIEKHYDNNQDVIDELGAIGIKFKTEKFESYNDYPESAKNAAKRALEFRDKNPDIECGTAVGWTRANQLAKGEMISEETIARMASFARHLQYKDVPYTEGCGGLMVDAWGGQAGIEWASNKLKEIRGENFEIDTTGLTPYVDPGVKKKRIEDVYSAEVLDTIIAMAAEMGYSEDEVEIVAPKEKFANPKDADYTPARTITQADGVEKLYRYESSRVAGNSRSFCRRMMGLRRFYSREEIDALDTFNEEFGPGTGGGQYSIFLYLGGVACQHYWQPYEAQRIGKKLQLTPVPPETREEMQANTAPRTTQGRGYVKRPQRNLPPLAGHSAFSKMLFADDEKRIVVGACMIPNIEIYRRDEDGDPYYVKFSEETIKEIAMKYMKQARTNEINQDHIEDKDAGTYIFESWIVEDPETDKAKTIYGYDVPKGTWMCAMKVEDPKVWKRIKDGELKGFSVEGSFADMEELEARRNYEKIKRILKG